MTGQYIVPEPAVQTSSGARRCGLVQHAGRGQPRRHRDDLGGDALEPLADVARLEQPLPQRRVGDQLRGGDVGQLGRRLLRRRRPAAAARPPRGSRPRAGRSARAAPARRRAARRPSAAGRSGSTVAETSRYGRSDASSSSMRTRARPRTTRLKRPSGSSCAITTSPTPAIGATAGRSSVGLAPRAIKPIARKRSPVQDVARHRAVALLEDVQAQRGVREQHHVGQRKQRHPRAARRPVGPLSSIGVDIAASPEDVDARSGQRRRRPGRQVKHDARDVFGRHVRLRPRHPDPQHLGVDGARADGVDGDAVVAQLVGQRARQADDAVFGGAVRGQQRRPLPPGDRRDVDDAAAAAARASRARTRASPGTSP